MWAFRSETRTSCRAPWRYSPGTTFICGRSLVAKKRCQEPLLHRAREGGTADQDRAQVRAEPRTARAKVNPKPWEEEHSSAMGGGDPVGAHRQGHIPP